MNDTEGKKMNIEKLIGTFLVAASVIGLLILGTVAIGNYLATLPPPEKPAWQEDNPKTVQHCDYFGLDSGRIIAEMKEQGYRYTGRSSGFLCGDDVLNFELEVENGS